MVEPPSHFWPDYCPFTYCFQQFASCHQDLGTGLSLIYGLVGLVIIAFSIPLLDRIGVFDILTARSVEYDYGSGLARDAVIQILDNLSTDKLWFGIDAGDAFALQHSYGLIAIEIAWANFILICGLIFTIPLFIAFCLFWFRFLPKHCAYSVLFVSTFTLALTFAYNSIWSKTTVLAITVAIAVSNLRRDRAVLLEEERRLLTQ